MRGGFVVVAPHAGARIETAIVAIVTLIVSPVNFVILRIGSEYPA
jgi:hypothetical protein